MSVFPEPRQGVQDQKQDYVHIENIQLQGRLTRKMHFQDGHQVFQDFYQV